jgi:hypothetical protein
MILARAPEGIKTLRQGKVPAFIERLDVALSFVVKLEHHSLFVFSMHYYKLGA